MARTKGSLGKKTEKVLELAKKLKTEPLKQIETVGGIALKRFAELVEKEDAGVISMMESKADVYLKIAANCAAELASYTYPKLKAIERITSNPLEGMTHEQKLEAMRQAVKALEAQSNGNGSGAN
jgi:hypothetical protein